MGMRRVVGGVGRWAMANPRGGLFVLRVVSDHVVDVGDVGDLVGVVWAEALVEGLGASRIDVVDHNVVVGVVVIVVAVAAAHVERRWIGEGCGGAHEEIV